MSKRMRLAFYASLLFVVMQTSSAFAQTGVLIDTLTFYGVASGQTLEMASFVMPAPVDTMLWGGKEGASMLRFTKPYLGYPGEFRVATEGPIITQVSFNVATKNVDDAKATYAKLAAEMTKLYGDPPEKYSNVYHSLRWFGKHQDLLLQTQDGGNYVTIILKERHEKPAGTPAPDVEMPQPTRHRK